MKKLVGLLVVVIAAAALAEEEQKSLISIPLLEELRVSALVAYRCRPNYRCELQCSAGQAQGTFARQNVHRMELAMREDLLLVAAMYTDAVGKPHRSTAILPRPAGCVVDNLVVESVTPLVDGALVKPIEESDVIFDMKPEG